MPNADPHVPSAGSGGSEQSAQGAPAEPAAAPASASPTAADSAHTHERVEWFREMVTMALYVGLSLLAVLVALPPGTQLSDANLALTLLVTAIALLFAHQLAFRLSTRLVNQGLLDDTGRRLLSAQLVGGVAVAVVAAAPVFFFGPSGIRISELLLLAFVGLTGYKVARSVPTSRLRALAYVALVGVAVLGVLLLKASIGH